MPAEMRDPHLRSMQQKIKNRFLQTISSWQIDGRNRAGQTGFSRSKKIARNLTP